MLSAAASIVGVAMFRKVTMGVQYQRAVSLRGLCKGARECKQGVSRKESVMEFYITRIASCERLQSDLKHGRYRLRRGKKVQIYRPKRREAESPYFRDRVWQRSMCNNGVYDDLTRGFILDNIACQKGKGNDMAIRRVIRFLQTLYRSDPDAPIYGVHLDIRKYFPSTPHALVKAMDAARVKEPMFLQYLEEIVDGYNDERSLDVIAADPFGARGTGLGSQINQLNQIALINPLDHELKRLCRFYIRYNDDFLILTHDKAIAERAKCIVCEWLKSHGLEMTDKSGIFTVNHGFYFLRKRFIVKPGGKIIIRLHKRALSDERAQLRRLHTAVKAGEKTMVDVHNHYQSWVANAEYAGDAPIRAMDAYYCELFGQKPQYKRKRRYLYGNYQQPARPGASP